MSTSAKVSADEDGGKVSNRGGGGNLLLQTLKLNMTCNIAGGTSFCGMANSNMPTWMVPRYHCMPRKGELLDGRVGSWTNQDIIDHVSKEEHSIVANGKFDAVKVDCKMFLFYS